MKQKELSVLLRVVVALAAVAGLIFFAVLAAVTLPAAGGESRHILFLGGLLLLLIPLYLAMIDLWKIFTEIGRDHSFCMENARRLRRISFYALFDTVLLLGAVAGALALRINPYGLILFALLGLAATAACAALSHLTRKAAALQSESELTI